MNPSEAIDSSKSLDVVAVKGDDSVHAQI